ncbi:RNA polymerase sigma-70 factor [Pedobacter antarcticus]|uniref:RNA polymerase sigma factor n=1 Tax=Pedobacter antarcticus TaxID=34086 RepID=UPI00292D67DB|nr:RNA polymerase sigma-70 factor [Pedobacter antarcticus]
MEYRKHSDQELVAMLKQQDHGSFTEIYRRYWAILFRHARKMLYDDEEASDIIQDIFTLLWTKAAEIEISSSLSSYLYTAVRHKVFTRINRGKLKTAHLESLESFLKKGVYSTDEWILEKELTASIESEVARLPGKMREIFELSRKEHLSYQQIAERLQVTDHTVRKQISNALKVLKTKFGVFFSLMI